MFRPWFLWDWSMVLLGASTLDGTDRRGPTCRIVRVLSRQVVPANLDHVREHFCAICKGMNAGPVVVRPQYRHLGDRKAHFLSQKQNFRIESPALDSLQREDGFCAVLTQRFEPALGIVELEPEEEAQKAVEHPF